MPGGRERLNYTETKETPSRAAGQLVDFEVRMRYGVPYQGSKNKIAEWVVEHLPSGHTLVDLFAGGCAVTHAALLAGRWDRYIANDIGPAPDVFLNAVHGRYADERRWISREDFYQLKDADPYVSLCWSFGNNRSNYLYVEEVEPWKRALHYARVLGDTGPLREFGINSDGSAADVLAHHDEYKEKYIRWWLGRQRYAPAELDEQIKNNKREVAAEEEQLRAYLLTGLKSSGMTQAKVQIRLGTQMAGHYFGRSQWAFPTQEYYEKMQAFMPALTEDYNKIIGLYRLRQRLQRLQRLQSLESLQSLQRLQRLQSDYERVEVPRGAVVYADPPYRGTAQDGYGDMFDHERFDTWLARVPYMVIISEYICPAGCVEVANIKKRKLLGAGNGSSEGCERLFVQERFEGEYYERLGAGIQMSFEDVSRVDT